MPSLKINKEPTVSLSLHLLMLKKGNLHNVAYEFPCEIFDWNEWKLHMFQRLFAFLSGVCWTVLFIRLSEIQLYKCTFSFDEQRKYLSSSHAYYIHMSGRTFYLLNCFRCSSRILGGRHIKNNGTPMLIHVDDFAMTSPAESFHYDIVYVFFYPSQIERRQWKWNRNGKKN